MAWPPVPIMTLVANTKRFYLNCLSDLPYFQYRILSGRLACQEANACELVSLEPLVGD